MRKLALGLAGAAALAFGTAANAEITIGGGTTVTVDPIDQEGDGASFAFAYSEAGPLPDPFEQFLVFNNTLDGSYIIDLTASGTGDNEIDITELFLTGGDIVGQLNIDQLVNTSSSEFFYEALDLAAGMYTLTVRGNANANSSFAGNVSFNSNSVPEPGTWAMMLMGFGAAGFALRRKRSPAIMQIA